MSKKEYYLCPPFLKGNHSHKTSSHVHPIFPYLSFQSQPTKMCLQKCHFSTSKGDSPPSYKGGLGHHDTNSNNPLFSGNSIKTTLQNYHTTHTCIVCSISIFPPQDRYSHFLPNNHGFGFVNSKLCWGPLRRVNWTQPNAESRKISVATRPKPAKAWQGLVGIGWDRGIWDWLGCLGLVGMVGSKISQDGLKVYGWWIESLEENLPGVMV